MLRKCIGITSTKESLHTFKRGCSKMLFIKKKKTTKQKKKQEKKEKTHHAELGLMNTTVDRK